MDDTSRAAASMQLKTWERKTLEKTLLSAFVGAAIVVGASEPANAQQCQHGQNPRIFDVQVAVVGGKPVPMPEPINLKNCERNVKIHWELDPNAGFHFKNGGIDIKDTSGQFSNGHPEDDRHGGAAPGRHHYHDNKNSGGGQYKYSITVYPNAGGPPSTVDPTIINRP